MLFLMNIENADDTNYEIRNDQSPEEALSDKALGDGITADAVAFQAGVFDGVEFAPARTTAFFRT